LSETLFQTEKASLHLFGIPAICSVGIVALQTKGTLNTLAFLTMTKQRLSYLGLGLSSGIFLREV